MRFWGLRQKLVEGVDFETAGAMSRMSETNTRIDADHLPSFLIVGPPRTGSSWLHEVLETRANLPSPTKETRFFDSHFQRGLKWYRHHFPAVLADRPTGEVAPTYFSSPEARERIAKTLPGVKIIFTFREPIQRCVSLYRVKCAYGMAPWSFEEALDRDPELLESGKYATHLKAWRELFPEDQLLVTLYDDLRNSPQDYLRKLSDFLGIRPITLSEDELGHVHSSERMTEPRSYVMTRTALAIADWCKARKLDKVVAAVRNSKSMKLFIGGGTPFVEMSQAARARTTAVFAPEIDAFEQMIGRDLSEWKSNLAPAASAAPKKNLQACPS